MIQYNPRNKEHFAAIAAAERSRADLEELYRSNVNAHVTTIELLMMDDDALKRIIAVCIWHNNYKGIIKQVPRYRTNFKEFIMQLLGIHRTTLARAIKILPNG